jgi:mannose-6-phosphate isomerase-like protein (cupin superfamily)
MKYKIVRVDKDVQKRWGCEIWIANTDKYLGKILIINPNDHTSLHVHDKKEEHIYVFRGSLVDEDTHEKFNAGSVLHIKPGVEHMLCAGRQGATLFEVSTPHPDDSRRIKPI